MLSDKQFDVSNITIVGLDLMEVERVTGRLTWPRVIIRLAGSRSWKSDPLGENVQRAANRSWWHAHHAGLIRGISWRVSDRRVSALASILISV